MRRGLPASLEHVVAGAPLTCGLTTKLTNNVFHRSACRLHPQVGAAVTTRHDTNEVCAHDPSRVHSLCCIECFSFAYLALPHRLSPPFQEIAITIAIKDLLDLQSSGSSALVSSAVSCRLLSHVLCCPAPFAASHSLLSHALYCLIPSVVSYPLLHPPHSLWFVCHCRGRYDQRRYEIRQRARSIGLHKIRQ